MHDSASTKTRASRFHGFFPALLAATALGSGGADLRAQSTSATAPVGKPSQSMKQFVIIFHQGANQLSEADKQRRTEETRAWAQLQNAAGHKLTPCILDPECHWSGANGESGPVPPSSGGSITALLFLEARDFAQAVEVATAHPAIRFGSSVEVRPWGPPIAPASPAR